ncbi:MAG: hypothetical protein IT445_02675 [Phycisphaeraceae bacterium]|nr:hypothetical protein [Phycisphaeraceae bacterium]
MFQVQQKRRIVTALGVFGIAGLAFLGAGSVQAVAPPVTDGLIFSMDAGDVTESGGVITQANDQSGRNNHAANATTGPTLVSSVTPMGQDALRFDNTLTQYLEIASNPTDFDGQAVTVYVVFKAATFSSGARLVNFGFDDVNPDPGITTPSGRVNGSFMQTDGRLIIQGRTATNGTTASVSTGLGLTNNTDFFLGSYSIYDSGNMQVTLYTKDGTIASAENTTGVATAVGQNHVKTLLGANGATSDPHAAPTGYFNGDLAAVLIYDHALDTNEQKQVEHYLFTTFFAHPGDANGDGMVNLADLQILGDNWQSTTAKWSLADFTWDGMVNLADLQIIGDNWGYGAGPDISFDAALQQVGIVIPEPASLTLLVLPLSLVLRRRW